MPRFPFVPDAWFMEPDDDIFYSTEYPQGSQILIGIVLYLVSIFGTVGNLTLILALRKNKRLKNASNLLTISLAASDVLISAVAMPISGYAALSFDTEETIDDTHKYNHTPTCRSRDTTLRLSPFLCTLNGLIIYVSSRISTWTLAGMALERFIAVLHPLNYNRIVTKRRMFVVIITIWIISLIVELPQVGGWFPFVYYHNAFGCLSPSYHHMGYKHPDFLIFSISKKVILTLLPTPLIGYCYYRILTVSFKNKQSDDTLRKRYVENGYHKSRIKPDKLSGDKPKKRRMTAAHESLGDILAKTTQKYNCYKKSFIWLIIVISYVICWSPVSITGITMNFLDAYCEKYYPKGLIITVFVIAIMNSCVNPVIYGFLHQQIRRTFLDILCCRSTQSRLRIEQQHEYLGQDTVTVGLGTRAISSVYPTDVVEVSSEKSVLSNPLTYTSSSKNTDKSSSKNTDKSSSKNTDKSSSKNTDKSSSKNTDKSSSKITDKSSSKNTDNIDKSSSVIDKTSSLKNSSAVLVNHDSKPLFDKSLVLPVVERIEF
ncbi:melatonin receptor type 1A-like [Bolinopsis microptera]|uniref:melatonin receptor type 1A-like n=1 Tax=Bolinopsis microptera TaxID=2820187 RepID=UPI00307AC895